MADKFKLLSPKDHLSYSMELSLLSVKPLGDCNTTEQRTNPSYLVSLYSSLTMFLDEVKWKLRAPTAFAMSQLNYRYEGQINQEITNFLSK